MKKFIIVLLAITALSSIASASVVEFAYVESANYFKFLSGSFFTTTSTSGTTSTSVNVTFHYVDSAIDGLAEDYPTLVGALPAKMTVTATRTAGTGGNAGFSGSPLNIYYQFVTGSFDIVLASNSAFHLLQGTFSGYISGSNSAAQISATDSSSIETVSFSSSLALLDFTTQTDRVLSATMNPTSVTMGKTGNNLKTFYSPGSWQFSADPGFNTPEPSSLLLTGLGSMLLIGAVLRRKKVTAE